MDKATLYQTDELGRVRIWTVRVDQNGTGFNIITENGLLEGKLDTTITPITIGKGGKSVYTQACADANTKFKTQLKAGYVMNINEIKKRGETATIKEPAKGYKYHSTGLNKDGSVKKGDIYTLDGKVDKYGRKTGKHEFRNKLAAFERKLDGYRYRLELQDEPIYYSSSGDVVPGFPHITARIKYVYKTNPDYYRGKILDGEMYNHELRKQFGFNIIQEACSTRVHLDEHKLQLRSLMQFHLFDICMDLNLKARKEIIMPFADGINIINVETFYNRATEEVIEGYMDQFQTEEYEGLMIKMLDRSYEYKKSTQMLKYKPEDDDEFLIVGFEKSLTGDTLGALICQMPDGKTFKSDTMDGLGTDAMKQYIWDHKDEFLRKWVNIKFMEYTRDGKPRLPKARYMRKGKSTD